MAAHSVVTSLEAFPILGSVNDDRDVVILSVTAHELYGERVPIKRQSACGGC